MDGNMARVTIDFEVRSQASLKDVGAHVYAEHPSTMPVCLGIAVDGHPARIWLSALYNDMQCSGIENKIDREGVLTLVEAAEVVSAHNATFEGLIWPLFAPEVPFPWHKVECTAAMASYHALPRGLDDCCAVLGLPGKDAAGALAMRRVCIGNRGRFSNHPEDLHAVAEYCKRDAEIEARLAGALRALPEGERRVWALDRAINDRGVRVDLAAVEAIAAKVEQEEQELQGELFRLTGGALASGKQVAAMLGWLKQYGVEAKSLDQEGVAALLARADLPPLARRVLEMRKDLAASAPAKLAKFTSWRCRDGRARGLLLYHGAATGRWSGRGIQPQNFPRGDLRTEAIPSAIRALSEDPPGIIRACWGPVLDVASSCLRALIIPEPGKRFLCADFSAVEARGLAWLAGQEEVLATFRAGRDLYKDQGARMFGKPAGSITPEERQVAKTAVLACGYQGSVGAFQSLAKKFGLSFPDKQVKAWVKLYRSANPKIVAFWYDLEEAAAEAILTGKCVGCGRVAFKVARGFLLCSLPSGRLLHYFRPEVEAYEHNGREKFRISCHSVNSYTRKWDAADLYGGLLAENITQAVCRDVMAEAMLRVEAAGYPVVLTVHDEVLAERKKGGGSLEEFEALMKAAPRWTCGFPIDAKGWEGHYYRKG